MSEVKRNVFGYAVPPEPKFAEAGKTGNSNEYKDKVGKTQAAPGTLNADGTRKYADDGCTTDWLDAHPEKK